MDSVPVGVVKLTATSAIIRRQPLTNINDVGRRILFGESSREMMLTGSSEGRRATAALRPPRTVGKAERES